VSVGAISVGSMARTVFHTAVTLNGFLADEADSLDWLFAVPGAEAAENDFGGFLATVGAFVMGATTYEWVLRHEERERPGMWRDTYGTLPCFVVTHRTLPTADGGDVRFVRGAIDGWWHEVVAAAGADVIWLVGGGELVGQVDDAGLLEEIRLSIAPALLPAGKPLLPRRIGADRLRLREVRRAGSFIEAVYDVDPAASATHPRA
jgi:dihydrofolate reductase